MRFHAEGAPRKIALGALVAAGVLQPVIGVGRIRFQRGAGQSFVDDREANQRFTDLLQRGFRFMATAAFLAATERDDQSGRENRHDQQHDGKFGQRKAAGMS